MTVSRVLSGSDRGFSAETRQKVLDVVRELEYVPVGQPMTQSRHIETRTLGLLFDGTHLQGQWGLPTFLGLREAAQEHDYDLLMMLRQRPDWMLDQEELQFLDRRNDGFIFIAPINRYQIMETLLKRQLPVVSCYTFDVPPGVPTVVLDNANAMGTAVRHVVERGHRRILHLSNGQQRSDFVAREQGYAGAMEAAGLEPLILPMNPGGPAESPKTLMETIRRHGTTAIVCANDNLATFAWDVLEAHGLKIPQDISITGMDDLADPARRGLTSIHFSCEELGREAIEALVSQLKGGNDRPLQTVIPMQLIERSSVAPPPGS